MKRRTATALKVLPPTRARALELVAAGARTGDVASTLGVHRATVWKWTREPEFQDAIQAIREEATTILSEGLRNQAARAVIVLGEQMESPDPRTRRDAARIVLTSYARLRPAEPPDVAPELEMTDEEAEEQILDLWRYLEEVEVRQPGFIASSPELIKGKVWALEILARRNGGGDIP